MTVTMRRDGDKPMYLQIKEALQSEIVGGSIPSGTRLPSSRKLARELEVSRITVTNAFEELQADGLVQGDPRRGVFVLPLWETAMRGTEAAAGPEPRWQQLLENDPILTGEGGRSDPLLPARDGDMIAFNVLRHDLDAMPLKEFGRALRGVLREEAGAALDYGTPEGYPPLRLTLAQYLRRLGIRAEAEDVLITSGAQQAIDLLCQALVHPGGTVVVEEPTYSGALRTFRIRRARIVGVPMDSEGMRTDILGQILERESPQLIYTIPTFHNPTGVVMSAARRKELVTLAHDHGVPVLEDDYMREIRFGSPIPQPLAAFDRHGDVIHVGTFSKSLMPTLRLGYAVARGQLRGRLIALKRGTDLCSSSLMQRALCWYLTGGATQKHWRRVSLLCRRRQTAMIAALRRHFPKEARWSVVDGGFVMWVSLPPGTSVSRLRRESLEAGVDFAPGEIFFVEPADQGFIRLGFAAVSEEQIERGVRVLGQILRSQMTGPAGAGPSSASKRKARVQR